MVPARAASVDRGTGRVNSGNFALDGEWCQEWLHTIDTTPTYFVGEQPTDFKDGDLYLDTTTEITYIAANGKWKVLSVSESLGQAT